MNFLSIIKFVGFYNFLILISIFIEIYNCQQLLSTVFVLETSDNNNDSILMNNLTTNRTPKLLKQQISTTTTTTTTETNNNNFNKNDDFHLTNTKIITDDSEPLSSTSTINNVDNNYDDNNKKSNVIVHNNSQNKLVTSSTVSNSNSNSGAQSDNNNNNNNNQINRHLDEEVIDFNTTPRPHQLIISQQSKIQQQNQKSLPTTLLNTNEQQKNQQNLNNNKNKQIKVSIDTNNNVNNNNNNNNQLNIPIATSSFNTNNNNNNNDGESEKVSIQIHDQRNDDDQSKKKANITIIISRNKNNEPVVTIINPKDDIETSTSENNNQFNNYQQQQRATTTTTTTTTTPLEIYSTQRDKDNNENNFKQIQDNNDSLYPINEKNCGIQNDISKLEKTKIFGADKSNPDDFLWMAAIIDSRPTEEVRPFCGGSLITRRHVLTAAHCLQNRAPRDILVRLGSYDFDEQTSSSSSSSISSLSADYAIDQFRIPSSYNKNTHISDIAILRLKTPLTTNENYRTVCLPKNTQQSFVNALATVTGYGTQSERKTKSSPVLKQITVPIWENRRCSQMYRRNLSDSYLCAGYEEGGLDACQGDSGGPLMTVGPDNKTIQVAVVAFGYGTSCGVSRYPGVYTRVTHYLDWIIKNTRE